MSALRRASGLTRALRTLVAQRDDVRTRLAARFLSGEGIEVGALHTRFPVGRGARVRYVDRLTVDELRAHYPELDGVPLVEPDVVDDGETLAAIGDGTLDFIVASHFIEHTEDPIGTIENHLRKLRPGGVLLLVVPDMRATFDRHRRVTPLEHVVRDHEQGTEWSRAGHFEEWVRDVNGVKEAVDDAVERLMEQRYSIHFHVWTPAAFVALLVHCRERLRLPFELEAFERAPTEFFVVLSKTDEAG